jgi:hypothetical protein
MDVTTVWQLFVSAVISSGVFVVGIEMIHDYFSKKREKLFEIAKYRMETISRAAPYYSRLAVYNCWNISWMLEVANENCDYELVFYYLCNVLYLRNKIIQKFGELQLDNLEAEDIIGNLGRTIVNMINKDFGFIDASRMRCLVEDDLPYHKFHESISNDNRDLYKKFRDWISNDGTKNEVEKNCRWYADLIMLELNRIYEPWYGEPPNLSRIHGDLRSYLSEKHPNPCFFFILPVHIFFHVHIIFIGGSIDELQQMGLRESIPRNLLIF